MAAETLVHPPAWDESGWHYDSDAAAGGPITAQYVLVLDALNFCFWPSETVMEYDTLALALKHALVADPHAFDADRLMTMTAAALAALFAPHDLPNAEERARKLREVGSVLSRSFDGLAYNMIRAASQSAEELVSLVVSSFAGFRDEVVYESRQIFLYKRAQIFVADVWAAYGQQTSGVSPVAFRDIGSLTCFADYRIPQLFRAVGVFEYAAPLAARVDAKEEIAPGSSEEVEIRACTVAAVELLQARINAIRVASGKDGLASVQVDWLLWQEGELKKDTLAPHHRTRTIFY